MASAARAENSGSADRTRTSTRRVNGTGTTASAVESAVNLANTTEKFTLVRYRADDIYANPGSLVGVRGGGGGGRAGGGGRGGGGGGGPVLLSGDGSSVFYQGTIYDKNPNDVAPKTFLDKVAIRTGEKARLFESDNKTAFERVSTILDIDTNKFIIAGGTALKVAWSFYVAGTSAWIIVPPVALGNAVVVGVLTYAYWRTQHQSTTV